MSKLACSSEFLDEIIDLGGEVPAPAPNSGGRTCGELVEGEISILALADFRRSARPGMRPFCRYWLGGTGLGGGKSEETRIVAAISRALGRLGFRGSTAPREDSPLGRRSVLGRDSK